jgi:hypothetical protein
MSALPSLTGRVRYRVEHRRWRSDLVVLQVEWSGLVCESIGGQIDCERRAWWRDARLEDVPGNARAA